MERKKAKRAKMLIEEIEHLSRVVNAISDSDIIIKESSCRERLEVNLGSSMHVEITNSIKHKLKEAEVRLEDLS